MARRRWVNGVIFCPGGSRAAGRRQPGGERGERESPACGGGFCLRFFGGAAKMGAKSRCLAAIAGEKTGKREGDR